MEQNKVLSAIMGGSILIGSLILLALAILVLVFYLLTMQKALTLAGKEHRRMEPGMVWLMLIPLFGLVWQFFIVNNVSEAVRSWAAAHDKDVADGGRTLGLTACILACCGIIPLLGILASIAALVCMILWWVKVSNFNSMMA